MAVLKNRAKMSTSTTGTGTITLGSALSGYQSFTDAGLTTGAITRYTIQDGVNWEIGLGTYTTAGTTLTRTPSESSSGGSAINLSGNAEVFITAAAEDVSPLYDANFVTQTTSSFLGPNASGTDAVAIGLDAEASGTRSVSIGTLATGTNVGATASGNGAVALGGSNASGLEAFSANNSRNDATFGSTGANSVTLGYQSRAQATYSVAIGYAAIAGGQYGIALGFTRANGEQSFSIGQNASTASGENTIVIGKAISSSVNNEIAIGGTGNTIKLFDAYTLPTSDGAAGTALVTNGSGALSFSSVGADLYAANPVNATDPVVNGDNSIAIGSAAVAGSVSGNNDKIAIGTGATAGNNQSVLALGYYAAAGASGQSATAVGALAVASGPHSTAIGSGTDATATSATALGYNAQATGSSEAVAIGNSRAGGAGSFAAVIANNTSSYGATNTSSIAIGDRAKSTNYSAIAVGLLTQATGDRSTSIGLQTQATANYATAIGSNTYANGTNSVSLGTNNYAQQYGSISIGFLSRSDQRHKFAFAGGGFNAASGSAQQGLFILRSDTTDATAEALTTNGSAASTDNQIVLSNNSAYGFTGTVIAREDSSSTNDFAVWEIKGGAVRAATASTTTLGSYNINKISESTGAANWSIALSADTTNGAVAITVTGEALHSIRWVATVNTTEVTY